MADLFGFYISPSAFVPVACKGLVKQPLTVNSTVDNSNVCKVERTPNLFGYCFYIPKIAKSRYHLLITSSTISVIT